jgi:hypothetical protein
VAQPRFTRRALGEQEDAGRRERHTVDLGLDVDPFSCRASFSRVDLDFIVEMADVADDGLILHASNMFGGDDVAVAGGGDVDVGFRRVSRPW